MELLQINEKNTITLVRKTDKERKAYDIVRKTSIGKRYGTMIVEWEEEQISGLMEILGHREAFHGKADEAGKCRIEGRLISLTRTIPYIAVGKIGPSMLQLSLRGERNNFEIEGSVIQERVADT